VHGFHSSAKPPLRRHPLPARRHTIHNLLRCDPPSGLSRQRRLVSVATTINSTSNKRMGHLFRRGTCRCRNRFLYFSRPFSISSNPLPAVFRISSEIRGEVDPPPFPGVDLPTLSRTPLITPIRFMKNSKAPNLPQGTPSPAPLFSLSLPVVFDDLHSHTFQALAVVCTDTRMRPSF